MSSKVDYVYILAASHSGSTLLAMLLGSHPEMVTIGELASGGIANTDGYRCSCRRLIHDCSFWQRVTEEMLKIDPAFDISRFGTSFETLTGWWKRLCKAEHRGPFWEIMRDVALWACPQWRESFPKASRNYHALTGAILSITGARVIVDSSKVAHWLKFLGQVPNLNIKVVHLVRDGRAVALTYKDPFSFADAKDPSLRAGGRGLRQAGDCDGMPMARAADEWRRCIRSAEFALARLHSSQWMRIRYEQLCSDPDATLKSVLEFAGVDPSRRVREFRSVEQHIIGNGMRLDSSSEIMLDERWRSVLSVEDLRVFDRVAGKVNRRYGYS